MANIWGSAKTWDKKGEFSMQMAHVFIEDKDAERSYRFKPACGRSLLFTSKPPKLNKENGRCADCVKALE